MEIGLISNQTGFCRLDWDEGIKYYTEEIKSVFPFYL
jgi:hypothetical protein